MIEAEWIQQWLFGVITCIVSRFLSHLNLKTRIYALEMKLFNHLA